MERVILTYTALIMFILSLLLPSPATATSIGYTVDHLSGNRWQYAYHLSDFPFDAGHMFTVYFDHALFGDLEVDPPVPSPDWLVDTWDPDPLLQADGGYAALAMSEVTALYAPFSLIFEWKGVGLPGSQHFAVHDFYYEEVHSGVTSPVPEPSTALAVGYGIVIYLLYFRKKKRS